MSFGEGLEQRNMDKIKFAKFDITKNQALSKSLGILSTPSFVVIKDGDQIEQFFGDRVNKDIIEEFFAEIA